VSQSWSASGSASFNLGGFYRISMDGKVSQRISSSHSGSSGTPGGRVAAAAKEPHGNLPNQSVITNNPSYGFVEAQNDLYTIRKWAGDLGRLVSKEYRNETIMALFDAASRYYPEVDTKKVIRIMLADIKSESDFESKNVSPGRVDSGDSVGLLQVSPYGSGELKQFKRMAQGKQNTYSWTPGTASEAEISLGGFSELGPLMDFKDNQKMDISKLSNDDLSRPWVNIHIAMWTQSNLGRSGSQDPSDWGKISSKCKDVRQAYAPALRKLIPSSLTDSTEARASSSASSSSSSKSGSSSSGSSSSSSSSSSGEWDESTYKSKLKELNKQLKGTHYQKPSFATALGSWVAGPSASDDSGYSRSGDDISGQYFSHISKGLSVLYTGSEKNKDKYGKKWLEDIVLVPGLVDFSD